MKIFGESIAVRASVHTLGGFSAHADQHGLLEWFAAVAPSRPRLIITHGEDRARRALSERISAKYGIHAECPHLGDTTKCSGASPTTGVRAMSRSHSGEDSENVSLADEEAVKQVLWNSILGLWDVVNNLTRLRPSRRDRYRVTIFGSARVKPGSFGYEETKRAAAELARLGCDVVTGGGPGLMEAANAGAASVSEKAQSIGIRVDLPFEQEGNEFVTLAFEHRTFFTRLHQFVLTSDAFLVAPGGIGTVLETFMIWQLLQVRHLHDTPLVLIGKMWPGEPGVACGLEDALHGGSNLG